MERLLLCFPKQTFQNAVFFLGEACSHADEKVRGPSIITCNNSKWNSLCCSSQTKYDERRKTVMFLLFFSCSKNSVFAALLPFFFFLTLTLNVSHCQFENPYSCDVMAEIVTEKDYSSMMQPGIWKCGVCLFI